MLDHTVHGATTLIDPRLCAQALAGALCYNRHIEVLDLSDNDLGDEGVESLAVSIGGQDNCQIKKLVLADNKIDDSGATALAEMLFLNNSITSLDLRRESVLLLVFVSAT